MIRSGAVRPLRRFVDAVATRSRPTTGPRAWRDYVVRARTTLAGSLAETDPEEAVRVLEPLLTSGTAGPAAWRLAFGVVSGPERGGRSVLEYARDAITASERAELSMVLAYRKLASDRKSDDHLETAYQAIATYVPASQRELESIAKALRYVPLETAQAFQRNLAAHGRTSMLADEALNEAVDELRLVDAHGSDPTRFAAVRERVLHERRRPLRVIGQALRRVNAWDELAVVIEQHSAQPGAEAEEFPYWVVSKAATTAFGLGATRSAIQLARQALAVRPDDPAMAQVLAEAEDQLAILADGWRDPGAGRTDPPHMPRPGAVLSVLGQSLPIRSGGYATRSHGILLGLADRGWDMRAVTRLGFPYDLWRQADDPRAVPAFDVVDGIEYHRILRDGVYTYPRHPLAEYVAEGADGIVRVARDHGASIVHAASLYDVGLAGLSAARRLGVPFVYELRGLKQLLESARRPEFAGSDRERFLDAVELAVVREADAVLVITAALGEELVRLGADPERLVVVPNGVHADRFHPRPRDSGLERELGVAGKTVIGYAGGLVHYEGLVLLLEAAKELSHERDDFHVLVVGDGAYERPLHHAASELGAEELVTFTGRVSHDEVGRYLSLIDIAPFPRLPLRVCELISPIKPFEAMAMGKAVVGSDVAALAEIIADGATGRLFAKGDAKDLGRVLGELLDDPGERARLGAAARDWVVRERDWSAITATVDSVYRSLVGVGDHARPSTSA